MDHEAIWVLGNAAHSDEHVEFRCAALVGALPSHAIEGLGQLEFDAHPLPGHLMAVETPVGPLPPATETYVRGADHVSTHAPSESFPFRTQLYWSGKSLGEGAVAVTLGVSLQTDLLDTKPELTLHTTIPGASAQALPGDACRFDTGAGVTLIVTSHPSDAAECDVEAGDGECRLRVTPPFLEKGVIRRFRLAAIVLPGTASDEAIAMALADLAEEPLPLTT